MIQANSVYHCRGFAGRAEGHHRRSFLSTRWASLCLPCHSLNMAKPMLEHTLFTVSSPGEEGTIRTFIHRRNVFPTHRYGTIEASAVKHTISISVLCRRCRSVQSGFILDGEQPPRGVSVCGPGRGRRTRLGHLRLPLLPWKRKHTEPAVGNSGCFMKQAMVRYCREL